MSEQQEPSGAVPIATGIINVVLWIASLYFIYKGGYWLGGRWYHWIFSLILVGIAKSIIGAFIKIVVKVAMEQKAK